MAAGTEKENRQKRLTTKLKQRENYETFAGRETKSTNAEITSGAEFDLEPWSPSIKSTDYSSENQGCKLCLL